MNQKQVNSKLNEIAMQLKSIDTIGLNDMEYLAALIYAIYGIEQEPNNFLIVKELVYTVQILDEQLYKIRKNERSEKLFINIRFREVIKNENYLIFKKCVLQMEELVKNTQEYGKKLIAEAFEDAITKAAKNNEISFQNTEYYTPNEIVKTMIDLLPIRNNSSIYNPACGVGNFIVESAKLGSIYAFGDESNISNYNICMTNLWLHNIGNKRIDNIKIDKMPKVDYVVANPPFAINNMQKGDKKLNNMLYKYGVFENASSYSKFIVMMLESVQEGGKISVVLPHGFLFKKTISECNLRKYLVDNGYIEAIISLPEKMFNGTKIPVIILVLQKKYREEDIIYIDASKEYIKGRKLNSLSEENQSKIIKTYENKSEISNYSIKVGAEIIRKNDYNLNIKKYLKSLKKEKSVNIKTEKQELQRLEEERVVIERKNRGIIKESIRYK